MEGSLSRILVVDRGQLGRRRIDLWKKRGLETVLAFGEAEAEAEWVEAADFAVFSKAAVGEIPKPQVIIEHAMDSGCDAVDAGPLIDNIDLLDLAVKANLALVGCDIHTVAKYRDAAWIRERAAEVGVPASPWSEGRPVTLRRRVDSVVLVDRHGGAFDLGTIERSLGPKHGMPWLLEHGQVLGPSASKALGDAAKKLADLSGAGVVRVCWAWLDQAGWVLQGMSAHPGPGWPLIEAVHGMDLARAQVAAWLGGAGISGSLTAERHGIFARVLADASQDTEAIVVGSGFVEHETGTPVVKGEAIAGIAVAAPTRQAALVKLAAALDSSKVSQPSNLSTLQGLVRDVSVWQGAGDVATVDKWLASSS